MLVYGQVLIQSNRDNVINEVAMNSYVPSTEELLNCLKLFAGVTQYLDNNTDLTNGELKAAPEFIESLEKTCKALIKKERDEKILKYFSSDD